MSWTSLADHYGLPEGTEVTVDFLHTDGVVSLHTAQGRQTDEGLALRGMVDPDTWRRIRADDIFGASTRTQQPGPLQENQPLRITVLCKEELPEDLQQLTVDRFVISDAMNQIDPAELAAADLDGEVWAGVRFSDPEPFALAIRRLADNGFTPVQGLVGAVTVAHDRDAVSIEFRRLNPPEVLRVQAVYPLPMGDEVDPVTYEFLNRINRRSHFGTVHLDAGDLLARHAFPEPLGEGAPELIADKVYDLLGLLALALGPVISVASGEMSLAEGEAAIID
jgi:hypothetical protein